VRMCRACLGDRNTLGGLHDAKLKTKHKVVDA